MTSYNNTITIINNPISVSDGFETKNVTTEDGNAAIEIVSDGKSFCGTDSGPTSTTISIDAKKIAVYIWFEGTWTGTFILDITADDITYNSILVQRTLSGAANGYLQINNDSGKLVNEGYTEIQSTSGLVKVGITGYTSFSVPIHFSIVVLE